MRHKMNQSKLGRPSDERVALVRNQVASLFEHGYLNTTLPRSRAVRSLAERLITRAKRAVANSDLSALRECARHLPTKVQLRALLRQVAPAQADVASGYTQVAKLGYRRGDGALIVRVSLKQYLSEPAPKPATAATPESAETAKPKAVKKPAAKATAAKPAAKKSTAKK